MFFEPGNKIFHKVKLVYCGIIGMRITELLGYTQTAHVFENMIAVAFEYKCKNVIFSSKT